MHHERFGDYVREGERDRLGVLERGGKHVEELLAPLRRGNSIVTDRSSDVLCVRVCVDVEGGQALVEELPEGIDWGSHRCHYLRLENYTKARSQFKRATTMC